MGEVKLKRRSWKEAGKKTNQRLQKCRQEEIQGRKSDKKEKEESKNVCNIY